MEKNLLLKYSQPPYVIIGLDLTGNHVLTLLKTGRLIDIKQIFDTYDDCKDFIVEQINNSKFVLIISGHLSNEQLTKIKSYAQIEAIYLNSKSPDLAEEFQCLYTKAAENKYWQISVNLLSKFWFLLGLLVILIFAYLFPQLGASGGIIHAEYSVKVGCVVIILFLSGLSLFTQNITDQLFRLRLHISIQIFSLLFVPCVVFSVALLLLKLSMNKVLITGIILMACTSTSITVNMVFTKNAGGNDYAALLNALFGNILGVFVSPAMISLFMNHAGIDAGEQSSNVASYGRVIGKLSLTVLLPLVLGQIINRIWTEKVLWAKEKLHFTIVNSIVLLILVWSVFCDLFQSGMLKTVSYLDLFTIITLNALFYISFALLAFFIARLPNPFFCRKENLDQQPLLADKTFKEKTLIERWRFSREDTIAFIFCSSTKTLAKGVSLIAAVYDANNHGVVSLLTLPLILYHAEQLVLGTITVLILQRWLERHSSSNKEELAQK